MKSNGLEKKLLLELKRQTEELKQSHKEELILKGTMFEWLKDHHVRLGRQWDEIVKRTAK